MDGVMSDLDGARVNQCAAEVGQLREGGTLQRPCLAASVSATFKQLKVEQICQGGRITMIITMI